MKRSEKQCLALRKKYVAHLVQLMQTGDSLNERRRKRLPTAKESGGNRVQRIDSNKYTSSGV